METDKQLVARLAERTRCGGEQQVSVERALQWAYEAGRVGLMGLDLGMPYKVVRLHDSFSVEPLVEPTIRLSPVPPTAEALLEELRRQGGSLQALAEAGLVAVKKGEDYNAGFGRDDYFPLGLASYAQMLWVKALRVVSFAKQPRAPNNEAVRDTLLDMINYASFAADWLGRQTKSCSTRADCGETPRWNYPAPINETKKEG